MHPTPTLPQREKELQALLATEEGRQQLEKLEARYSSTSGNVRSSRTSIITFILVHERERGMLKR